MIIKSKTFTSFTTVANTVCRNKDLSLKAKGLFLVLASLPSDWVIYKTQLHKFSSEGIKGTIAAFDELVKQKYILAVQMVKPNGQFNGWNYIVYPEQQSELTGEPILPFRKSEKAKSDSRQLTNKEYSYSKNIKQKKRDTNIEGKNPTLSDIPFSSLDASTNKTEHIHPTQKEVFDTFDKLGAGRGENFDDDKFEFFWYYEQFEWKLTRGNPITSKNLQAVVITWLNRKERFEMT